MPTLPSIIGGLLKAAVVTATATLAGVGLAVVLGKIGGNEGGDATARFTAAEFATASPAAASRAPETPTVRVLSARLGRDPAAGRRANRARVAIVLRVQTGSQPLDSRPRLLPRFTERAVAPRDAKAARRLRIPAETSATRVLRFKIAGDRATSLRRTRRATLRLGETSVRVRLTRYPGR